MKNSNDISSRQQTILSHLKQVGKVFVEDLVVEYGTTPQTIRKDLQVLSDANLVVRFHGGAVLQSGVEYTKFDARKNIAAEQKELIARAVAQRIPNNITLMINVGTTTAAVTQYLKHHAGLRVITDNVNVANDLRKYPGVEVFVPGGVLRHSDGAILGEGAVDFIQQFRAEIAIIGAAAISADGTLLDFDLREAHLARAIIENSKHVILAADISKLESTAPVQIGHLRQIDCWVVDENSNPLIKTLAKTFNVQLVDAQSDTIKDR